MVGTAVTKWNQIRAELIEMKGIVLAIQNARLC
jgi:hypothetical protein